MIRDFTNVADILQEIAKTLISAKLKPQHSVFEWFIQEKKIIRQMQNKTKMNDLEPVGERARYFATKQRVLVSNIWWHFCTDQKNRDSNSTTTLVYIKSGKLQPVQVIHVNQVNRTQ